MPFVSSLFRFSLAVAAAALAWSHAASSKLPAPGSFGERHKETWWVQQACVWHPSPFPVLGCRDAAEGVVGEEHWSPSSMVGHVSYQPLRNRADCGVTLPGSSM